MAELRDKMADTIGANMILRKSPGEIADAAMQDVGPVLYGWRDRALDAEASRDRARRLADEMKTRAEKILALDPVEDGISAGERYEAEVDLAVAARVLAALDGQQNAEASTDG